MNKNPFNIEIKQFCRFRKYRYQNACHSQNKTINYGNYIGNYRSDAVLCKVLNLKTKDTFKEKINDLMFSEKA